MKVIIVNQLRRRTWEFITMVQAGQSFTITSRGKPIAIIKSISEESKKHRADSFKNSWRDIATTIDRSKPKFSGWKEGVDWIRDRR
jgi:prevent-host-death family protein